MAEATKAANDVQAEFDALRRDVANLTDAVGRLLNESSDDIKARARERVQQTATAAQQAAGAAGTKVTDFVDERPATSLLIAFGAGLLFGSFFRRS
ncbi:hypothetical protein [Thalassobaculum sp.]|jgi:ElaB/YqjD/DUF883 family membrane-anchored ribosome-binding protein|uniref:hypothetical protein n=1 Tax=Thalassobaculum sp. TaxID=2022740 RepID=UPI0032EB4F27